MAGRLFLSVTRLRPLQICLAPTALPSCLAPGRRQNTLSRMPLTPPGARAVRMTRGYGAFFCAITHDPGGEAGPITGTEVAIIALPEDDFRLTSHGSADAL